MNKTTTHAVLEDDPAWYKDAIIYEVHVRAFCDADGDGVGDFRGLTQKLDYLQQLGVTAIWLLPFYPSPLRDDGYDIADYFNVHGLYGNLRDFKIFLREAHQRGLRVITELIVNHTSDQHPWFLRARKAKSGSSYRDFYVWSDTPDKYRETRIIFKDFEHSNWAWDSVVQAYYWHRFYSHQPDLNFDHPAARRAILQVMDFWFGMGVDGMRLDAVPYLFEREGTDCENLPETHDYLKDLRRHLDRKYRNRLLLAEANQWPEDAAAYFGSGDECHMNFHVPLMPRLFMSLQMEDRFPIIDILDQTPAIPDNSQWALFLRNHDELTLEMVTDEERDYMYRVYAEDRRARINLGIRRRLAPLLMNNRRRIELMNALLLSLPGTPVIYYGDELGMGDNIYLGDRDGVRTPMQWSPDRNAGFSSANPQSLYLPIIIDPEYHYETVNVEAQLGNFQSLLWWMKRIIALRKRYKAFGRGSIRFLYPENRKIFAFIREYGQERILVITNLSRFSQHTYLDLADLEGLRPVEIFGRSEFPVITPQPYTLTLGPHSFFWFSLEKSAREEVRIKRTLDVLKVNGQWIEILNANNCDDFEEVLKRYIVDCRWFRSKARKINELLITDTIKVPYNRSFGLLCLVKVTYMDAEAELYLVPVGFTTGATAEDMIKKTPQAVIARLTSVETDGESSGVLMDPTYDKDFAAAMLQLIANRRKLKGEKGSVQGSAMRAFKSLMSSSTDTGKVRVIGSEQTNSSLVYGKTFILKLFRRLDEGINPDYEIGAYLSEDVGFPHVPQVAGYISYERGKRTPITLGILHGYVKNQGDAWQFTLDELGQFFDRAASQPGDMSNLQDRFTIGDMATETQRIGILELTKREMPGKIRELIGMYLESARLLGQRTAEMHIALVSAVDKADFSPEIFTPFYRRALYQSMRNLTGSTFQLLRRQLPTMSKDIGSDAELVLGAEHKILNWFRSIVDNKIQAVSLRTHGDFHLGQVLYTGRDFVIVDFEGEPSRSLEERRLKRSPFRDVAGMLRSFHYAAFTALNARIERNMLGEREEQQLSAWAQIWHRWVSAKYLKQYLETASGKTFIEETPRVHIESLLNAYRLEKAIYELSYELNNRPDWVNIPLKGILNIIDEVVEL